MSGTVTVNKPSTHTQSQPVTLTGTAPPGAGVSITQDDGQHQQATANPDRQWRAQCDSPRPGRAHGIGVVHGRDHDHDVRRQAQKIAERRNPNDASPRGPARTPFGGWHKHSLAGPQQG